MIHSSGQIISAQAASDIMDGIGAAKDADGYTRVTFKAVCVAQSPTGADAGNWQNLYGFWVEEAMEGMEDTFVGIIGDDTVPYANRKPTLVDHNNPVVDPDDKARSFLKGDELTVERNGIISVIAASDITQGDYLKLADNGAFQKGAKSDGIGLAIESAEAGERFRATIWAL